VFPLGVALGLLCFGSSLRSSSSFKSTATLFQVGSHLKFFYLCNCRSHCVLNLSVKAEQLPR